MKIQLNQNNNPATDSQDCVVIPVFSNDDSAVLSKAGKVLDDSCSGAISAILDKGDFKGKLETTTLLYDLSGCTPSRVLLMGCGSEEEFDTKSLNKATQAVSKAIKDTSITSISLYLSTASTDAIQQTVIAFEDTLYYLDNYKSKKQNPPSLENIVLSSTKVWGEKAKTALKYGQAIANGMEVARDLANHPGNVCTPTFIAETAAEIASSYSNIEIEVLEESDMEKLGMGSFLSVSKGSDEPGKMVILQYFGAKDKKEAPVALVGKGVTFDT
ncbi:MAG TPA: leucyl aminopeptidase, partial [Leucothrix sp.]|nr:leucyl aminopeptidase [Leucothrix sp.]